MALPAPFLEELRARTPLAAVVGRRVRLARAGRHWKGCCPFHGEKTPSFYVYEDHFHCFGCGAHGDAISFVMQSQGADFMDAVRQLAAEAGLEVPRGEEAAAGRSRLADLGAALAAAAHLYQARLAAPAGAAARAYLAERGIGAESIARFGLGWSGEGRGDLAVALRAQGIPPADLAEAGLLREGGQELFFRRLMFPIRDRAGREIGFGGRILGDGQPKYLNGPETPLFAKRRSLYGLDLARAGLRAGAVAVAVEGYLDVIALHQAGFAGALAPLGTALTEPQLEELWRLSPMPVLCFDGDAAGARAAARAAELALPHLTPARSLKLATLPPGEDPDSLVRRRGPAAFAAVLEAARPLSEALFDLLREGTALGGPEQRAAFRARLEAAAARIADRALAGEYRRVLLDRFFAESRRRPGPRPEARPRPATRPLPPRPPADPAAPEAERLRILAAILLRHPGLLPDLEEAWGGLDLPGWMAGLRDAVLGWAGEAEALDREGLLAHLTEAGLGGEAGRILSPVPFPLPACAREEALPAEAERGWWHVFGLVNRHRLEEEVAAAGRDFAASGEAPDERRLVALRLALENLRAEPDADEPA